MEHLALTPCDICWGEMGSYGCPKMFVPSINISSLPLCAISLGVLHFFPYTQHHLFVFSYLFSLILSTISGLSYLSSFTLSTMSRLLLHSSLSLYTISLSSTQHHVSSSALFPSTPHLLSWSSSTSLTFH